MLVVELFQNHTDLVQEFCDKCLNAGYHNNSTLKAMKWGDIYDLPNAAKFWGLLIDDKLVSVSGCHAYDNSGKILRCLFRSATLPDYQNLFKSLSKNHMNSAPFSILLPNQITWGLENNYQEFIITTSHTNHNSGGKMNRTHRAIKILSKSGIVSLKGEEVIYNIPQTIWSINTSVYFSKVAVTNYYKNLYYEKNNKNY